MSVSRHFGQRFTVITVDQPLYSWGEELVWASDKNKRNVIYRLGGLHVCFNFLKAIGQHEESAGLDYVWIESGVFVPNTTERKARHITEQCGVIFWHTRLCHVFAGRYLSNGLKRNFGWLFWV